MLRQQVNYLERSPLSALDEDSCEWIKEEVSLPEPMNTREGCVFIWFPRGGGRARKKPPRKTRKTCLLKVVQFSTPNYTLTEGFFPDGHICSVLSNEGLWLLIHKEPSPCSEHLERMAENLKKHSLTKKYKCSVHIWRSVHPFRNEGNAALSKKRHFWLTTLVKMFGRGNAQRQQGYGSRASLTHGMCTRKSGGKTGSEWTLQHHSHPLARHGTCFQPFVPWKQVEIHKKPFAPGNLCGLLTNSEKWETAQTPTERKHVKLWPIKSDGILRSH